MSPGEERISEEEKIQSRLSSGTYFRDGLRRIDYVIVHEEVTPSTPCVRNIVCNLVGQSSPKSSPRPADKSPTFSIACATGLTSNQQSNSAKNRNRKADIRQAFLENLKAQGLEIEEVRERAAFKSFLNESIHLITGCCCCYCSRYNLIMH
jgi:hypothetical protein